MKVKVELGKPVTAQWGKFRLMYLLVACNDTVPISVCYGRGVRSVEYPIVVCCLFINKYIIVHSSLLSYALRDVTSITELWHHQPIEAVDGHLPVWSVGSPVQLNRVIPSDVCSTWDLEVDLTCTFYLFMCKRLL